MTETEKRMLALSLYQIHGDDWYQYFLKIIAIRAGQNTITIGERDNDRT